MTTSWTDKHATEDKLGIEQYIDGLSNFISDCQTPLTIAIQGDWGSGKTSMMYQVEEKLKSKQANKPIETIFFNTWQYSQFNMSEELGVSLITDLMEKLDSTKTSKQKFVNIATSLLKYVDPSIPFVNGEKVMEDVTNTVVDNFLNRKQEIKGLKDAFQKAVNNFIEQYNYKQIVIFIDDLDRLAPEKAVELLEVLKLFLDCEHCVFVLAIDYEVVVRGVKKKYGDDFDNAKGRAFFDKIIQVPFTVPVASYNIEQFIEEPLNNLGFDNEQSHYLASQLIQKSIGTNPRGITRLLNSVSLLLQVRKTEVSSTKDKQLILASVCLQLTYEEIYNWLLNSYNHANNNNTGQNISNQTVIEHLENNFSEMPEITNVETLDLDKFRVFYSHIKKIFNIKSNSALTSDNLDTLIKMMILSNAVATGNNDLKQKHTPNQDVQYVIRKLYNRFSSTHKIALDDSQNFGNEATDLREDDLSKEFKALWHLDRIRITRGKGQGLNILKDSGSKKMLIYLSGDTHGTMLNDGIMLLVADTVVAKKTKNQFAFTDAPELRYDDEKYKQFENEIIETITEFMTKQS